MTQFGQSIEPINILMLSGCTMYYTTFSDLNVLQLMLDFKDDVTK